MADFCLAPGEVDGIIDCTTSDGKKMFKAATAPLKTDFDLSKENMRNFLHDFKTGAQESGWNLILNVDDPHNPHRTIHLPDHCGQLMMTHLRDHVRNCVRGENRAAQDDMQIHLCLKKSLAKEAANKIADKQLECMVDGQVSGILLFKVIIREVHVDTKHAVCSCKEQLSLLDVAMKNQGSDIKKFNQEVSHMLAQLPEGCKKC